MLSTPPLGGRLFVEPLEQRIAPTNLVALANHPQDAGAPTYLTYSTGPSAGKLGFVPASDYGVAGANLYAISLSGDGTNSTGANGLSTSNGDQIQIFSSADGYRTFLQANNGSIVAFFKDINGDNQVQQNELVGLSLGRSTDVSVNGNVNGDIVTNLGADGNLMLGSAGDAKQQILSLSITGNVTGDIASGGDMHNVTVRGNVNAVLAGTAADGVVYDFGGAGVTTGTISAVTPAHKAVGASIFDTTLLSVTDRVQAGDGGVKGAGGSISHLTFLSDADGLQVLSGNGGIGKATKPGGSGGNIDTVLVQGVTDTSPNSHIVIQAGHGGDNAAFKGGAGGSISGVGTGLDVFDPTSGTIQRSISQLNDNIVVHAGAGGNGVKGGKGGSVTNSQLFGSIGNDGVINPDGTDNAEIQVFGGDGGANTVGGNGAKGGKGGVVNAVTAENVDTGADAVNSAIFIQGGNGGAVTAGGKGLFGGDVGAISILGTRLTVNAGNGADGVGVGGNGGNLSDITVLSADNLLANSVTMNAGFGGASQNNAGGAGGAIDGILVGDSDLAGLVINSGAHGNGGIGSGGKGGAGGTVSNVQINDSGAFRPVAAVATVRAGAGGDGLFGAGAGGDINTFQFLGSDFAYNVAAGNGGSVLGGGTGKGGAGGSLLTVGISNQPFDTTNAQFSAGATGVATAGNGGNGTGNGGAGGDLSVVNLRGAFDVSMAAGNGGAGNRHKAGTGGAVTGSAGDSLFGGVSVTAGNGGIDGSVAADGGSIDGFIAAAGTNIAMIAGNGGAGGAGGSITNSGTSYNDLSSLANSGSVTVRAGDGSSGHGVASAGGNITFFNGIVGQSGTTSFTAGNGGGGDGSTVSGAGGSVDQVKLTGASNAPGAPVNITFDGGDAGNASAAKHGAAGGSVTNITAYNLVSGTIVQHVAAGDGASVLKHGGAGGSVSEVHVGIPGEAVGDIGVRSGLAYGYGIGFAGGIFAGLGGGGSKSGGADGDVMSVTANAIASIAAGKAATPHVAGTVNNIDLLGLTVAAANPDGSFTNFNTANIVGSVQNPTAPGASTYKTGDGLIAARVLGNNNNFAPEAFLTFDANGTRVLVDYQEPSRSPVVTPG